MKRLISIVLAFVFVFILISLKADAFGNVSKINRSKKLIENKYAERFCSAKADHFFVGLENEKTLKYSYFKFIGLQSKKILTKDMYKSVINTIKEKCPINYEEESEILDFLIQTNESRKNLSDNSMHPSIANN